MSGLLIGYARVSTEELDLTAQRDGLAALGVDPSRIYVDYADVRVMPTSALKSLVCRAIGLGGSA